MKSFRTLLLLSFILFLGLSCSQKDSDKIGEAQICLDSAKTAAQANSCLSIVSGMSSSAANGVRCSAYFIAEGFTDPQTFVNAFSAIDSGGSSSNINTLMGLITFKSATTQAGDYTNAQTTFNYCVASGGKGATMISAFSFMPIALLKHFNSKGVANCAKTGGSGGTYTFSTCMTSVASDSTFLTAVAGGSSTTNAYFSGLSDILGNVVIATYSVSCSVGTATNATLCSTLSTAITNGGGVGNPSGVGKSFIGTLTGTTLP